MFYLVLQQTYIVEIVIQISLSTTYHLTLLFHILIKIWFSEARTTKNFEIQLAKIITSSISTNYLTFLQGEQKKTIITNVLQEDPRSVYLRERMENTDYVFRIAELYVSCKFDDTTHVVTVFQIFQDSVAQGDN